MAFSILMSDDCSDDNDCDVRGENACRTFHTCMRVAMVVKIVSDE